MDSNINELSKWEKTNNIPNKYNLRSKKKEGKSDVPNHPTRVEKPAKNVEVNNKDKKVQNPSPVIKGPIPEVREILNPPSYFSLEHEFQKIRIPVPLSELVKHEYFKRCLSKLL
jgi:hypothetical protein